MTHTRSTLLAVSAISSVLLALSPSGAAPQTGPIDEGGNVVLDQLLARAPGSGIVREGGKVTRVFGQALATGASPRHAAEAFRMQSARALGVEPLQLKLGGPGGRQTQGLMYDAASGTYKFTAVYMTHEVSGLPVADSHVTLLVKNTAGSPCVLAVSSIKEVRGLDEAAVAAAPAADPQVGLAVAEAIMPGMQIIGQVREVIWAQTNPARRAYQFLAFSGSHAADNYRRELFTFDSATNQLLARENKVLQVDVSGNTAGFASPALLPDMKVNPPVLVPVPFATVESGGLATLTDSRGQFFLPGIRRTDGVQARLQSQWTTIFNVGGDDLIVTLPPAAKNPASLLFNESPEEFNTAQLNVFLHTNIIHDFVVSLNPAYPGVDENLAANVNLSTHCNASFSGDAINFRSEGLNGAGDFCPNTGHSTVVYHEYGHFLVDRAGTSQGAYGEGMSDCIAMILTDQPWIGDAWHGVPGEPLRDHEDHDISFPCSGEAHFCGGVIGGSVWDFREALGESDPGNALSIVRHLTLNSILLNPPSIGPGLVVDFLTLDDDNGDILDGTPHYDAINAGFSAHGLPAPELLSLRFTFPDGLPEVIHPDGGQVINVVVTPVTQMPVPGTGVLHIDVDGKGFTEIPMTQTSPNAYEVALPPTACTQTARYFFSAMTSAGTQAFGPQFGAATPLQAFSAAFITPLFNEDFEADQGWTVVDSAGLDDGSWERGIPADNGLQGDPTVDADGSGQCFLTANDLGNSDVDGGSTTLVSPIMDASTGLNMISYSRWYANFTGSNPHTEEFIVEVSDDGGKTWVVLEVVGGFEGEGSQDVGGWIHREFLIEDFVQLTDQFRIRFTAQDQPPQGALVEAAVDAVKLRSIGCQSITADFNGDGSVNGVDLGILLSQWAGDGAADLNGDNVVNGIDLGILLANWTL